MTRALHLLEKLDKESIKRDSKEIGRVAKEVGTKVGSAALSGAKKVGAYVAKDHQRGNEIRHANKLRKIERRKEKLQAKAGLRAHKRQMKVDAKLQKKKLQADIKLYKYDPLIH